MNISYPHELAALMVGVDHGRPGGPDPDGAGVPDRSLGPTNGCPQRPAPQFRESTLRAPAACGRPRHRRRRSLSGLGPRLTMMFAADALNADQMVSHAYRREDYGEALEAFRVGRPEAADPAPGVEVPTFFDRAWGGVGGDTHFHESVRHKPRPTTYLHDGRFTVGLREAQEKAEGVEPSPPGSVTPLASWLPTGTIPVNRPVPARAL
jgi:hypothetical protein